MEKKRRNAFIILDCNGENEKKITCFIPTLSLEEKAFKT
jgi:hypothetical protein